MSQLFTWQIISGEKKIIDLCESDKQSITN